MHSSFQEIKKTTLKFASNYRLVSMLFLLVAIIAAVKQYLIQSYNNYLIFKYVFFHTVEQQSLYAFYPDNYQDQNHYGPIFSILIAPFAMLPDLVGTILWNAFNSIFLIFAVSQLNISNLKKCLILWLSLHEFLTSSLSYQFNPSIAAIIILSLLLIEKKKDFWAAFLIIFGTYIKIYGIVGMAFFFFSKNKLKFTLSLIFWSMILFILPMLISSPGFVVQSYYEWFDRLLKKNNENIFASKMQDISIMGMIRKVFNHPNLPNLPVIAAGLLIFLLPYFKINLYKNQNFRYLLLSSVLIFTVIFSTASESPTYIIAFMGVVIWFVIKEKPSNFDYLLLIFAIILTSFSPSDLFPKSIRENIIQPYALKALPCFLIWLKINWELLILKNHKISE